MSLVYCIIITLVYFTANAIASPQLDHASLQQADSTESFIDTYDAKINYEIKEQSFHFTPDIRPLVPIPGGRQAFYTYLWDFGDGNFSTQKNPTHSYAQPGDYQVTLYAVNNYDNGPPPKRPKRKVSVSTALAAGGQISRFQENFFASNGIFELYKSSDALPGTDLALVVGVKPQTEKGKIIILSNEKAINPAGFAVLGQSQYFNESPDSSLYLLKNDHKQMWANISKATKTQSGSPDYGNKEELEFSAMEAVNYFSELYDSYTSVTAYDIQGQEASGQFSLINLDVTEDMLADTNAIVTITGIYLPENGLATIHQLDVPVVTSHDPNKMSIKPARLSYRMQYKKKKLTYKVQFQNDGEGDAKNIRLKIKLPKEVDPSTFELLNLYPQCDSCQSELSKGCYTYKVTGDNTLEFLFKDIALPGTAASDITDIDSTKGFIRFHVETYKKLQNRPLRASTEIFFDKNDPIKTNNATARFLPGLSPIVIAGLNSPFSSDYKPGIALSFGLAPIAPYKKPYWQVELSALTYGETTTSHQDQHGEVLITNQEGKEHYVGYTSIDSTQETRNLRLAIPLQLRYNFNRWISAGAGAVVGVDFNLSNKSKIIYHLRDNDVTPSGIHQEASSLDKSSISSLRYMPFIDINIGRTYLGPALGLRYLYDKDIKHNGQLYLIWRL